MTGCVKWPLRIGSEKQSYNHAIEGNHAITSRVHELTHRQAPLTRSKTYTNPVPTWRVVGNIRKLGKIRLGKIFPPFRRLILYAAGATDAVKNIHESCSYLTMTRCRKLPEIGKIRLGKNTAIFPPFRRFILYTLQVIVACYSCCSAWLQSYLMVSDGATEDVIIQLGRGK